MLAIFKYTDTLYDESLVKYIFILSVNNKLESIEYQWNNP